MRIIIEVEMGNSAMETTEDVVTAIKRSSLNISCMTPVVGDSGVFKDVNGNKVGTWRAVDFPSSLDYVG